MSFAEKLGLNYRLSQRDADGAHEAIRRYFVDHEEWTEEMEFADLVLFVERERRNGPWPTLGEAIAKWNEIHKAASRPDAE